MFTALFSHDILYFFQQLLDAPSIEEAWVLLEQEDYDMRFEFGIAKSAASFTKQKDCSMNSDLFV